MVCGNVLKNILDLPSLLVIFVCFKTDDTVVNPMALAGVPEASHFKLTHT